MKRKRLIRFLALGAGCAVLVAPEIGVVVAQTTLGDALQQALSDPLSVLNNRSPGARSSGELVNLKGGAKAKPAGLADGKGGPDEGAPAAAAAAPPAGAATGPLLGDLPGGPAVPGDFVPGGFVPGGPGGGFFPFDPGGGGGGGGIIPPPPVVPPVTPPVTPEVPEPATWAMLIIGFFGLGSVLRRRVQAGQKWVKA